MKLYIKEFWLGEEKREIEKLIHERGENERNRAFRLNNKKGTNLIIHI